MIGSCFYISFHFGLASAPKCPQRSHRSLGPNLIERFFNKLKHFRAIATRYDKLARNFLAGVQLAAAMILLN